MTLPYMSKCCVIFVTVFLCGCSGAQAPVSAQGCWVHAFAGEDPYRAPATSYTGPTHEHFFLKDATSLMVGPGARLETPRLVLGPGARVPDLAALGADVRGEPFQLLCEAP